MFRNFKLPSHLPSELVVEWEGWTIYKHDTSNYCMMQSGSPESLQRYSLRKGARILEVTYRPESDLSNGNELRFIQMWAKRVEAECKKLVRQKRAEARQILDDCDELEKWYK